MKLWKDILETQKIEDNFKWQTDNREWIEKIEQEVEGHSPIDN